jgi:metal-dependent HD superfamily phosphatase/phosphodiesterase
VTFESVREHPRVKVYVRKADEALAEIGYTEHGERHVGLVAHIAYNVLKRSVIPSASGAGRDRRLSARHRQCA